MSQNECFVLLYFVQSVKGEVPMSPAFVALVVALLVYWLAYTAKTKLQE